MSVNREQASSVVMWPRDANHTLSSPMHRYSTVIPSLLVKTIIAVETNDLAGKIDNDVIGCATAAQRHENKGETTRPHLRKCFYRTY